MGNFPRNDEEEYLCDIAASALLYPDKWLRPSAISMGPSLAAVCDLAVQFSGSLEATALAWIQLELWPCAIVFWEKMLKPTEYRHKDQMSLPGMIERPVTKFRVSKSFRSSGFPYFLPRFKSVDDDSTVSRAADRGVENGPLPIPLGEETVIVNCEARFVPYRRNGVDIARVISLLKPI